LNRPLHIRGARIWDSHEVVQRDLYIDRGRIVAEPPHGAEIIDLNGYTLFPGLINAHDHLELNHYPRSKFRERYDNAHQWGEDMNARLNDEPYKSLRAYPLEDRCFIGGLKNLLCGATTVVHHNPPHKCLFKPDFPVRVLKEYGWAHSLHFDTDAEIVQSYHATPKEWPWFIHLAEGRDAVARTEFNCLKRLDCIGPNFIPVHGVGLTSDDENQMMKSYLVLCPTTNLYLLGGTLSISSRFHTSRLLLGSDSRLTAEGDLLDELRVYQALFGQPQGLINPFQIYATVVTRPRIALGMMTIFDSPWDTDRPADFIAVRVDFETRMPAALFHLRRADLALVIYNGVPRIGEPHLMDRFADLEPVAGDLDGKAKAIHPHLARRIHRCSLKESGLEVELLPKRGFFFS
jgi:cytosine/adenosine deaminase-related metal-dependent hydrolase